MTMSSTYMLKGLAVTLDDLAIDTINRAHTSEVHALTAARIANCR